MGKTYADIAKQIRKRFEGRENDDAAQRTMKSQLTKLMAANENSKAEAEDKENRMHEAAMRFGGNLKYGKGGRLTIDGSIKKELTDEARKEGLGTMSYLKELDRVSEMRCGGKMLRDGGTLSEKYLFGGGNVDNKNDYSNTDIEMSNINKGQLINAAPNLYDLAVANTPDQTHLKKVDLEEVSLDKSRALTHRNTAMGRAIARQNVLGTANSSGQALSALASQNAAITESTIQSDLQSYITEDAQNNAIRNQEEQLNTNLINKETELNEMNDANSKSVTSTALHRIAQGAQGALKDQNLTIENARSNEQSMNVLNAMYPDFEWGVDPEDDKLKLKFLQNVMDLTGTEEGDNPKEDKGVIEEEKDITDFINDGSEVKESSNKKSEIITPEAKTVETAEDVVQKELSLDTTVAEKEQEIVQQNESALEEEALSNTQKKEDSTETLQERKQALFKKQAEEIEAEAMKDEDNQGAHERREAEKLIGQTEKETITEKEIELLKEVALKMRKRKAERETEEKETEVKDLKNLLGLFGQDVDETSEESDKAITPPITEGAWYFTDDGDLKQYFKSEDVVKQDVEQDEVKELLPEQNLLPAQPTITVPASKKESKETANGGAESSPKEASIEVVKEKVKEVVSSSTSKKQTEKAKGDITTLLDLHGKSVVDEIIKEDKEVSNNPLKLASKYLGIDENNVEQQATIKGFLNNAVPGYIKNKGEVTKNTNAWCAAFVNEILSQGEYGALDPGKDKYNLIRAKKYAEIGSPVSGIDEAMPGDVIVTKSLRNNKWAYHTGFYSGQKGDKYTMLGGNQGDRVSVKEVAKDSVYAVRRIKGVADMKAADLKGIQDTAFYDKSGGKNKTK
jgi:uncharacterized protein (TIGR02594 family)|tara:strand:- start:9 stop:2573 length:2565 start_codon:yes stop_codon:yes gene_type:complete